MNRVAVVVLNWNGITDTLDCLDSLQQQTYKNYQIVVIDNGSVDNSVQLLKEYIENYPDTPIHLICNPSNLGFAGGVNTGIHYALKHEFDYIALLNNDATVEPSWLNELILASKPEKIGIVTGLLLHEDGKTIDSTGDWYSKWGLPFPRNRNDHTNQAPQSEYVFSASGGASLYKASLFKDIGVFDEDFFAYYEDTDMSFRTQLAGYKILYTPKAVAYHKQGATSKKIPGFAVYQTFKNLPLLFWKNVPTELLGYIGIRFFIAYVLMYGNSFKHGNGWMASKGLLHSIVLSLKALHQRRGIQKMKRVSANDIKKMLWNDLPPDQTGLRKLRKLFIGK
jgi:GT2 family glycosyltransferase